METVKLRIARYDPETKQGGWSEHAVEVREKTTVLDCLDRIQRTDDASLGFRYACRVGMCGSCAMVVNGRDRWTCRTLVHDLGKNELTLEPLRNMPVIRDLAVDFKPLWAKYRQVRPALEPDASPRLMKAEVRRRRERIAPNLECISCGICYSACGYVASDPLYLGPHALNRAFTIMEDPRDGAGTARLKIIDNEHGCWKCHVQGNCTDMCPMELSPSAGIQHLKRMILRQRVLSPSRRAFAFGVIGAAIASATSYVAYQPKAWVAIGALPSIPTATFLSFEADGKRALVRRLPDGEIEALSPRCTHQGCPVKWNAEASEFQCPCHRGVFDRTGTPIAGPPIRPLERYQTRVVDGIVEALLS